MDAQSFRYGAAVSGIAVFLGIVFLVTGVVKLAGTQMMIEMFHEWGYSTGFMYLIGILEVAGSLLVIAASTRLYGAAILAVLMIGAAFTHIHAGEWLMLPGPTILLALTCIVAWAERAAKGLTERHA